MSKVTLFTSFIFILLFSCSQENDKKHTNNENNTLTSIDTNSNIPSVIIYNFFGKHRCPSCIAIENATIKTLDSFYAEPLKKGIIKRIGLNIDDEANKEICEKYQVFGSGIIITRTYKGIENTIDLTGFGFKFAKNKEEKFIEILKSNIDSLLKP